MLSHNRGLVEVRKEKPGRGFISLTIKRDMERFIELIPQWKELSLGLSQVVLSPGEKDVLGWRSPGIIGLNAWERELEWEDCTPDFYNMNKELFKSLEIPVLRDGNAYVIKFTDLTARAFQLLHVFVVLLCQHRDAIGDKKTNHSKTYWKNRGKELFNRYIQVFEIY